MNSPATFEIHPAAEVFPMMDDSDFDNLLKDIREHGLRDCIVVYRGKLIDGRNRLKAMDVLGIDPLSHMRQIEAGDDFDPFAYVLSMNLHRRHLTTSQRAMVAARIRPLYQAEAHALKRASAPARSEAENEVKANFPATSKGQARDKAGNALKVSGKSVDAATKVLRSGNREVIEAVEKGEMTLHRAAQMVNVQPLPGSTCSPAEQAVKNASFGRSIIKALNHALHLLSQVEPVRGTELLVERTRSIEREIQSAKAAVLVTMPSRICPRCSGDACPQCGNLGWVNAQLAKELRGAK